MSEIYVIPQITLTENGPAVTNTITHRTPQLIHLQQGSLDGACGPYCLCMALITLGIEKHTKLTNLDSPTKSFKKLLKFISNHSDALVTDGTGLNALERYARTYTAVKTAKIAADLHGNRKEAKEGKKRSYIPVKKFIVEHLLRNARPVIIGTVHHYALAVGLGFEDDTSRKDEVPRYILLLDPDVPAPKHSAWNGVIDISVRGNNWYGTGGCNIEGAIALWTE